MFIPHTKLRVANKAFRNTTYNDISGIGIPEILRNIISGSGFVRNTKSGVILSCHSKSVFNHPSKSLFFMKSIQVS